MDQRGNNRAAGIGVGVFLLLLSLPATWLMNAGDRPGWQSITGTNGTINLWATHFPIWLIVAFGVLALLLNFMNQRYVTSLPRITLAVPAAISVFYVGAAAIVGFSEDGVEVAIGAWLAASGLGIGMICSLPEYWARGGRQRVCDGPGARFQGDASSDLVPVVVVGGAERELFCCE